MRPANQRLYFIAENSSEKMQKLPPRIICKSGKERGRGGSGRGEGEIWRSICLVGLVEEKQQQLVRRGDVWH
jgi:hypothetical protein